MTTETSDRQDTAELSEGDLARQLRIIRRLLAKAESTPYKEEAEACLEKVSELIARYAIDEALLWARSEHGERSVPIEVDLAVLPPYSARKSIIVSEVADVYGCRTVRTGSGEASRVVVFGFEGDVRRVELLVTSLLVQLTTSMIAETPAGRSATATAAWRRSYIAAFADAVGRRLRESVTRAKETAAPAGAESSPGAPVEGEESMSVVERVQSTEIVLADRAEAVQQAVRARFPRLRTSYIGSGNSAAGHAAGRAAGNRADLGTGSLSKNRRELGA